MRTYFVKKAILAVSVIVLCSGIMKASVNIEDVMEATSYPLKKVLNSEKPYLFYIHGHNGENWCIVTEEGADYKVVYGTKGTYSTSVDSLHLNSPVIKWGFDEFSQVYKAPAKKNQQTSPNQLIVRTKDNNIITAEGIDISEYAAPAADKINELYYTLYWLSNPRMRNSIKTPENMSMIKSSDDLKPVYDHKTTGLYWVAEFSGAYSIGKGFHPDSKDHNFSFIELDAIGGWKFTERFGVGLGLGVRKYFRTDKMFAHSWGMPIFVDLRGNLNSYTNHKLVPIWIVDLGWTIPDGFMFRPQFGLKFGQPYQFIATIGYVGQFMRRYEYQKLANGDEVNHILGMKRGYTSAIMLKIGYEF